MVAEMVGSHGRCALVTVAAVRGSAPREPGARMVIAPDGSFHGTIGGGELEWRAIGAARDALSRDTPAATLSRFTLGPDLGQCCGGSVRLLTEVFERDRLDEIRVLAAREAAGPFVTRARIGPRTVERTVIDDAGHEGYEAHATFNPASTSRHLPAAAGPAGSSIVEPVTCSTTARHTAGPATAEHITGGGIPYRGPLVVIEDDGIIIERFRHLRHPLWLFGAGHVGRALMLALAPLPFDVTWIDGREGVFPAVVPASVYPLRSADAAGELARAPDGAYVVVMTHNHPLDLAIVHAALAAERFGYVGLIGSASKRARFVRRLRDAGIPEARVAALVCPIGLPTIRSKHPAAIAAGIVAQLLERADA